MKKAVVLLVWGLFVAANCAYGAEYRMRWQEIGRGLRDVRAVLTDPAAPGMIYAAARGGVFKSSDAGTTWKRIFSGGFGLVVNGLCFGDAPGQIYAAAEKGAYYSGDGGRHWQRIFSGEPDQQRRCTSVAVFRGIIYLGTEAGLVQSVDAGTTWQKVHGVSDKDRIVGMCAQEELVVASVSGIFIKYEDGRWKKAWDSASGSPEQAEEEELRQNESDRAMIRCIVCSGDRYLAGVGSRLAESTDQAVSWRFIDTRGLRGTQINALLLTEEMAFAGADGGVFAHHDGIWQSVSKGLGAGRVRALAFSGDGAVCAGCDNGLYRSEVVAPGFDEYPACNGFLSEPTIRQVQEAAVSYADVDNEKISRWRKQASQRAWLPDLSVGLGRDTGDLWHWEGGSTTIEDDDFLRKGKSSIEWDISLSWDLAELIWNQDQTSIDVRSKLMVELRDDILDQVTRLYFERVRIAEEIRQLSADEGGARFDKQLKLREVTASLDALTGGLYSSRSR